MPDPGECGGLVLDTSVWINLLATEMAQSILGALKTHCTVPSQVAAEIKRNPITGEPIVAEDLLLLGPANQISIVELNGPELELFLDLVGAAAVDALGDGEAAAISVAVSRGLDLAIDDKKARRILRERFKDVKIYWTVELLRAPSVIDALGARLAEECFANARRFGRMHVPRL